MILNKQSEIRNVLQEADRPIPLVHQDRDLNACHLPKRLP
jgi:hypothetical protein